MDRVNILYKLFMDNIPFSFSKMNDGEGAAISNIGSVISRGDDVSTQLMSDKLRESLNYQAENYFIGLPCEYCRRGDYDNICKFIDDKSNMGRFFNANILINSNVWSTYQLLKNYCGSRRIVVVSNENNLKNIGKLEEFNIRPYKLVSVSERNAFERDYERIKDEWKNFSDGDLVICLCGPLGRVLCYEWFKANPKLTCLELGSLFDPFLKNRSYAYHTQNHTPCYGCFPVNNISDEQTKFIDRLIENPLIENECYYAHNYHDTLEFYLGMFQCNLDRMRSNTLIRLKKNRNESFMRYLLSYIECSKLENYINEKGHKITEGHCFQNQKLTKRLVDLIREVNPMRVLEIGFNAGHSSTLFLMNSNAKVVSFDLFWHEYVNVGKEYIDKHFPERHILIRGDSLNTLPEFLKVNKEKYDLFYIDGGKHGDTIRSDLNACMKLSHEKSLIILNDTIMTKNEFKCGWNYGATNTWLDMIDEDKIIENGSEDYEVGKGISWGNFNKKLDLDEEFLRYKALSRLDLYKGIEGVYYGKNYVMVDKLTKFYIDVFGHMENNELRMVKFYRAYSSSNYDEKVALYESLLKNPELENYLHSWTSYNLSLTYPYDSNPIPKIIHFIYLKQREFEKYHLRCISSASHFFPNYEVWVHNDIEPVGNPHWDAMKKLSNVQIKKTRRRKMFDDFPLRFVQYEADVIRLELLYKYGGIYLDTDLLVVKNFENIINTGKSLYISEETENGGLINSFLASKKGNEFLRIWLDSFRCGLRMDNWAYHIRESNAILLKNNPHYKIKYGVERLSYIHFFPFSWTNRGAFDGSWKVVLDEKTYGVHLFDTILHDALQSNKFFEDYYNI